jgi:hypothetical protein
MLIGFGLLILAGCAVALRNWRWGILAALAVGLLQDPLRKMIPGTPAYLVMASLPVWIAAMVSAATTGALAPQRFLAGFPRMGKWFRVFAAYLIIPMAISASYGAGTWKITLLGLVVYSSAFLVLVLGWRYPEGEDSIGWFLGSYVVLAAVLLAGGPLEAIGLSERFAAIGTEVLGHVWVTHRTGAPVYMRSGFFRGPDVMGWHAALVFMVSAILAFRSRGKSRWLWMVVAVWGVLNIWLCGRRKMLSMVPIFLGVYMALIFRARTIRNLLYIGAIVLLIIGLGWYFIDSYYHDTAVEAFYLTALTEAESSLHTHGIRAVATTIRQAGFWGYGLGMSQQGIHNIQAEKPRVWQESGPGKLFAELGVPGAILFAVLGAVLLATAFHVVRRTRTDATFYSSAGILSVLLANLASAVVSAQIFGDPLVALLLSFLAGLLFSTVGGAASRQAALEVGSRNLLK